MNKQVRAWRQQGMQLAKDAQGQPDRWMALVQQLAVRDPNILLPALYALEQAGPAAIPVLLIGLQHPHTKVRRNCVDIIDHGGYGGDARCVAALLPLLHDWAPHIRRAVWHTLFCERCRDASKCEVSMTERLDQVALLLEIGLQDSNLKLRRQLLEELGHHLVDPRVRPALEQIAQHDDDPEIRASARRALGLE